MRFYTSDLHVDHPNILSFCGRPFDDVDHMNAELIRRWNESVLPDDEVWIVGDLALGDRWESVPKCAALNGHKILICGNHDNCWAGGRRKNLEEWIDLYESAGITVINHEPGHWVSTEIGGIEVAVCHFPPSLGEYDGRYANWRPQVDKDQWVIHGHTHQHERKIDRNIHVGVDAWHYAPVPETEIIKLMNEES
jgi:calcineurin-like phosphoesterase family protein